MVIKPLTANNSKGLFFDQQLMRLMSAYIRVTLQFQPIVTRQIWAIIIAIKIE